MKYLILLVFLILTSCTYYENGLGNLIQDITMSPTNCVNKKISVDDIVVRHITVCDKSEFERRGCSLTDDQITRANNNKPWRKK